MAENGHSRRPTSNLGRPYPGIATRFVPNNPTTTSTTSSSSPTRSGNVPGVFVRPLSRSQLSSVSGVSPGTGQICRPPSPPVRPICLDQPRPNSERHRNLYLGAPLPVQNRATSAPSGGTPISNAKVARQNSSVTAAEQVRLPTNSRKTVSGKQGRDNPTNLTNSQDGVVTAQPTKRGLGTELTGADSNGKVVTLAESSIVCPYCRKCRCEACGTPRPLPSRWICSKSIHCGPEPLLDYVTCLCCVKALFYHCGKNHEPDGGVICADKPCSCAPHRKFWRWGCMTGMSVVLPCLCLYWPCKGCLCVIEKTYQRYHNNGCNCPPGSTNPRPEGIIDSLSEDELDHRMPNAFLHPPPIPHHNGTKKLLPPPPPPPPPVSSTK